MSDNIDKDELPIDSLDKPFFWGDNKVATEKASERPDTFRAAALADYQKFWDIDPSLIGQIEEPANHRLNKLGGGVEIKPGVSRRLPESEPVVHTGRRIADPTKTYPELLSASTKDCLEILKEKLKDYQIPYDIIYGALQFDPKAIQRMADNSGLSFEDVQSIMNGVRYHNAPFQQEQSDATLEGDTTDTNRHSNGL